MIRVSKNAIRTLRTAITHAGVDITLAKMSLEDRPSDESRLWLEGQIASHVSDINSYQRLLEAVGESPNCGCAVAKIPNKNAVAAPSGAETAWPPAWLVWNS